MTARLLIGDARQRIKEIPDGSIDLICTSPPFLALRKYGDNSEAEMGSEANPAAFIDALLDLTAEFRRVLAPHGSIAIELGDTYSGSGGAGGDYGPDGLRDGQPKFRQFGFKSGDRAERPDGFRRGESVTAPPNYGNGWPLAKSLAGVPEAFMLSLAYGYNVLNRTGPDSPAGRWRVRNVIVWARPNPPVGALGDKVRPATSYITVACISDRRWFDLDAVRTPHVNDRPQETNGKKNAARGDGDGQGFTKRTVDPAGAPPLDWWEDNDPTGHATLILPTAPYPGAHYATWPPTLAKRLIEMMCPIRVCLTCGEPSRRIVADKSAFDLQPILAAHIKERREAMGVTSDQINERFGYKEIAKNWERTDKHGAAIPNAKDWPILRDWLGLSDEFDEVVLGDRRWTESTVGYVSDGRTLRDREDRQYGFNRESNQGRYATQKAVKADRVAPNIWTDCGHNNWRQGHVLDPFAGSGTTLAVATGCGRTATGIELYPANADLIADRLGMFLEIVA